MSDTSRYFLDAMCASLGGDAHLKNTVRVSGEGSLPSVYAVTDLACDAVSCAGIAIAEIVRLRAGSMPSVVVDRRHASFWFGMSLRPSGWTVPPPWDSIAGDYRTSDGWIRLHTNAPHHRAAAQRVLGPHADKQAMATVVARWRAAELESAIVGANGCAAEMRSLPQWQAHPQGRALAAEPLIHVAHSDDRRSHAPVFSRDAPLAGLRVLDLTRVLAGPVATRFLAAYGAEVLRIDAPDWDEPGVVPEIALGKRCARLDLRSAQDRAVFEVLLADADMLVHGYRGGALDRLGYDAATRRAFATGLIDVSLDAYGQSGPWAQRRGFDSLVQMSAGIADAGMRARGADAPVPLPVQALDQATGYLMAAAAVRGYAHRITTGQGTTARLSLARTAKLLTDHGIVTAQDALAAERDDDCSPVIEHTAWGDARRIEWPLAIDGCEARWRYPAGPLGSAQARWDAQG